MFQIDSSTELIDHELLDTVTPDESIWNMGLQNYLTPFVKAIDSDPLITTDTPLDRRETVRIHADNTNPA